MKQPGHLTSMKKERGAGTSICSRGSVSMFVCARNSWCLMEECNGSLERAEAAASPTSGRPGRTGRKGNAARCVGASCLVLLVP